MQNNLQPSHETIPTLTGIRALAAFWVLLFHLKFFIIAAFPGSYVWVKLIAGAGNLGVDLFFMLSGFIISYNYSAAFTKFDWTVYIHYLRNRLARIYPVHLFTLIAMGIAVAIFEPGHIILYSLGPKYPVVFSVKTLFENLLLVQAWILPVTRSWNFFSWSISCEWLVYLLFPVFIMLLNKIKSIFILVFCCIFILIALVIISKIIVFSDVMYYGIIRVLPEFFAGCGLFLLHRQRAFWNLPWEYISIVALIIIIIGGGYTSLIYGNALHWVPVIMPMVIYGISLERGWLARLLMTRFMQYWGKVSYSLYMTSGVSIYLLNQCIESSMFKQAILYILLTVFVSITTYQFIEVPCRKYFQYLKV